MHISFTNCEIVLWTQKAKLPDYNPISSFPVDKESDERELEESRWSPGIVADGDLLMFLRAARSMAAFQGNKVCVRIITIIYRFYLKTFQQLFALPFRNV